MLKCPQCGKEETERIYSTGTSTRQSTVTVIFKCFFSATFDVRLTDKKMQKKLDEFKESGKLLEWLKQPFP